MDQRACSAPIRLRLFRAPLRNLPGLGRSRASIVSVAASGVVLVGGSLLASSEARADCTVRGTATVPKSVQIFAASKGTDVIATFTGQPVPASLAFAGAPRAALSTGGGFTIEGYVEPNAVPVFTTRNVTVAEGHVWIGQGRPVSVVSATDASVQVEYKVPMPVDQTVRGSTICEGLALAPPSTHSAPPPEGARAWVTKRVPLMLRGKPGGDGVFRFGSESSKGALLFWGTEQRGGAVKIALASDLVVDAWADARDLEAMPKGEMLDAVATAGTTVVKPPKVTLGGSAKIVKAPVGMPLRGKGDDSAPVIGSVQAGTEVAVLETILGWSNVVPTSFALMPPTGGGFWVKADVLIPPPPKLPSSPLK
jgi:hypothetical protein